MDYRAELLSLIKQGTRTIDIYNHFLRGRDLSRSAIISLLRQCGVHFRLPDSVDEISDERRQELQELSIAD